ncbi:AAA family ATPase [Pusillimonas sp. CC-YST705]|uniref:AAA family ATPase n=1 Tax=Mesopusillimonas faecipullorum TaxID=2755040 RepID=A0ABS8CE20_9BURK|nr:AAA family ATPase [Mesopusillimonas faecipullorum]MCB5364297.1 AAA family ATPase [Mesopusillimonas faecipullorum]
MKLITYRVTNFRSVIDSGDIEAGDVAALIGVNESGKTNLLLPLWKLNPAREGNIQPTSDYPKTMFADVRAEPGRFQFITADFDATSLREDLVSLTKVDPTQMEVVRVGRYFDGEYAVSFPQYSPKTTVSAWESKDELLSLITSIEQADALKSEEPLKSTILGDVQALAEAINQDWTAQDLDNVITSLEKLLPDQPAKTSTIIPRVQQTIDTLTAWLAEIRSPAPEDIEGVRDLVLTALPKFVYYSNYGNLDSEIYLPHVVDNLKRQDLGAKEAAKARTLRVLFSFVRLQPKEILQLGRDFKDPNNQSRQPTEAEIAEIAERKRERSILLQSAGTTLTKEFKSWWKQGDYRFRFEADGDHFRIWVSDDRRPEEVELENRSTGLQWFLSFYLVFLVESQGDHENAVLLLDEPGLSLHPLAQRDLSAFFDGLSETNQIIYTTHSPFLVDPDRLDRVRKVYVAADGSTESSPNLRQSGADPAHAGAAYAVYSALNLNIAESLLLGCLPVVVEGASDQHYLTMIKALLIGAGKIKPSRELVFPPAGGTKTLRITAGILTGRDEALPVVLLDGDHMGRRMATELTSSLYKGEEKRILSTDEYAGFEGSELEDLIPHQHFMAAVDRIFRGPEQEFSEVMSPGTPVVPQVEVWAKSEGIELTPGWKVEVSKRVKASLLAKGIDSIENDLIERWVQLFSRFEL